MQSYLRMGLVETQYNSSQFIVTVSAPKNIAKHPLLALRQAAPSSKLFDVNLIPTKVGICPLALFKNSDILTAKKTSNQNSKDL